MINRNYTYLRLGNQLPSVGVLQKILKRAGAKLDSDGIFGHKTLLAVQNFQRAHHLVPDGQVGVHTWRKLTRGLQLPIVDCIDIYDAAQREQLQRQIQQEKDKKKLKALEKKLDGLADSRGEVENICAVGGNPFVLGGMSNGVEQAICSISGATRNAFLLRFNGHGHAGSIGVGAGSGGPNALNRMNTTSLAMDPQQLTSSVDMLQRSVAPLRSIFGAYGSCEMHACQTGRGADGRQFLSLFASVIGVPVTAALNNQMAGVDTFKFRGPIYTATPSGMSLKAWCRALPDLPS